jgi:hypothetical protein
MKSAISIAISLALVSTQALAEDKNSHKVRDLLSREQTEEITFVACTMRNPGLTEQDKKSYCRCYAQQTVEQMETNPDAYDDEIRAHAEDRCSTEDLLFKSCKVNPELNDGRRNEDEMNHLCTCFAEAMLKYGSDPDSNAGEQQTTMMVSCAKQR